MTQRRTLPPLALEARCGLAAAMAPASPAHRVACQVAEAVMLGELFDPGPAAFVVVAGRWDDGERNTKLISEPLTLDAALVEYAGCACYPWRHIEYKGVCLDVLEAEQ